MPGDAGVIPAQALRELYRVLTLKAHRSRRASREAILAWADSFTVADSTWSSLRLAIDLAGDHDLQIWDALILAVAVQSHCRLLLSEDLQHGFTWSGVTVVNPYAANPHPVLKAMLDAIGSGKEQR